VSESKKSQHKHLTEKQKRYLSEYNKRLGIHPPALSGKEHYNWQGGKSFEIYPVDWNKTLKRSIRERDHYVCQLCSEPQGDEALSVHHIDKIKENCNPDNLISLCRKCHRYVHTNYCYFKNYWIK